MAQAWTDLPLDRPVSIDGPSADTLAFSAEVLPGEGPAIVTCTAEPQARAARVVSSLLGRLDDIARELYPCWLPAAAPIEDAAGAGIPAVRSIALRSAQSAGQYGPFLADLAERALRRRAATVDRFGQEVRAAGLARVIAVSFGRSRTALLIRIPDGFTEDNEQSLALAARWLTDYGGFGVWFTGAPLTSVDTVETVRFAPPDGPLLSDETAEAAEAADRGTAGYPAVPGKPHPASDAEQRLEAALGATDWASGREWNQPYQPHPLTNPVRVDLIWRTERCIVEIDGAEHREPARFAADRQRDVLLQLAGYAVLRFTNGQVIEHRDLVLSQIRQFLDGRRAENLEGAIHA